MPRVGIPLGTNYSSTRLSAASQKTVNMFPHSTRGFRQFPGLARFGSLPAAPQFEGSIDLFQLTLGAFSLADNPGYAKPYFADISFDTDGDIFSALHSDSVDGDERTLYIDCTGNEFDILNETSYSASNFTSRGSGVGYAFNAVGDRAFGASGDPSQTKIVAYIVVNTSGGQYHAAYAALGDDNYITGNFYLGTNIPAAIGGIADIKFNNDGSSFYLLDSVNGKIHQLACPSANYDLRGITSSTVITHTMDYTADIAAGDAVSFDISSDGTRFMVMDDNNRTLQFYRLTTAWDLSTEVVDPRQEDLTEIPTEDPNPIVCRFFNDKIFILCDDDSDGSTAPTSQKVYQYSSFKGFGTERAAIEMNGIAYAVVGNRLVFFTDAGNGYGLSGKIDGLGRISADTDGTNLVIPAGAKKYNYTVAGGIVEITDADLGDANTVGFLDRRFTFEQDGTNADFVDSDINDPTTIQAINRGVTGSDDDNCIAVFTVGQLAYMIGQRTIEPFKTIGSGNPPKRRQTVIERGMIGPYAIDEIDGIIYLMDNNRRPAVMKGLTIQPINLSTSLGRVFDTMTDPSDCTVSCFSWENENFAAFSFPTDSQTWVYHEPSKSWFELQDSAGGRYPAASFVQIYSNVLAFGLTTGKIYALSATDYRQDHANVTRTKHTGLITSELFGEEGQDMEIEVLYLTFESTGAATVTVSVATEADLTTFSRSRDITLAAGVQTVELPLWGVSRETIFQIETSANAKVDLIDAAAEIEVLHG